MAFIAGPVSVTIATGQKVYVSSDAALGALSTAGTGLRLYICYGQGGVLTPVGLGTFELTVPANQRLLYGHSAVITGLAAGRYLVGLCGYVNGTPANWNNNEYSYTSALIF
jgi:hypothetical protein